MCYELGQVFAVETCPPQGLSNSSNAWGKEILLQVILMENRGNPIFCIFSQFQGKISFQRLANMSYGLGQVFAHERCLSPEKRGRCLKGKMHLFRFFTISGGNKVFRG